jgi:serine/threonine protein kinase
MLKTKQVLQERYQLQRQLSNNAGRQTWLATDIKTSAAEPVTVKLLAFSPQMQWEEFKLFEREASVLKQLNHPCIPKYRDYFSLDKQMGVGLCWFGLVQEYIPGYSLQQLLDSGRHLTEVQVRSLATQVLEILTYLHGLNPPVLHRDIKPSNIIVGKDKRIYLVDFGAVADPTAVEGATFTVVGTAGYAPLEQFYGKAVPASDLYALGATLIHLLTGTAPADLPQSNLRIQFQKQVSLDPSFIRWIESLTEPDLDHRFVSAVQAIEALLTGRSLGYSERTSGKPPDSRIRLKKSAKQLVIQLPHQIVFEDFVKFGAKLILLVGNRLFLLLLSLILFPILWVLIYPTLVVSILLLTLLIFLSCPWISLLIALNKALLVCFGHQALYFNQENIVIERQLFIFRSNRCQLCQILDIQNIQAIPGEGIVIQLGSRRYVFGQELTAPEGVWLVKEIQKWLKFTTPGRQGLKPLSSR